MLGHHHITNDIHAVLATSLLECLFGLSFRAVGFEIKKTPIQLKVMSGASSIAGNGEGPWAWTEATN